MENNKSVFEILSAIDCSEHVERRNGLTYLSWAWAWSIVMKNFPGTTYKIYEAENGCLYRTDGRTAWVKTGVTINGVEFIETLPVMDYNNRSIPVEKITSFDANKAIQRSLTKAIARHGLGLYIYAKEDLPEEAKEATREAKPEPKAKPAAKPAAKPESKMLTLEQATQRMAGATDLYEVKAIWDAYPQYKEEQCFRDACMKRGNELKAEAK